MNDFVELLRAHGVIPADAPPAPEESHDRPWFIALLQGFAGWMAGILVFVFIVVVFDRLAFASFLVLGVVLLLAAGLSTSGSRAVFLDQLALAFPLPARSRECSARREHSSACCSP